MFFDKNKKEPYSRINKRVCGSVSSSVVTTKKGLLIANAMINMHKGIPKNNNPIEPIICVPKKTLPSPVLYNLLTPTIISVPTKTKIRTKINVIVPY